MRLTWQAIINRMRPMMEKGQHFLIRRRIWVLLLVFLYSVSFQIKEHNSFVADGSYVFLEELAVNFVLIAASAFMIEIAMRASVAKIRTINVLNARHNLSMQLSTAKDWNDVVNRVLLYPSTIMKVSGTSLSIYNPTQDVFYTAQIWVAPGEDLDLKTKSVSQNQCCVNDIYSCATEIHQIDSESVLNHSADKYVCYHMPLYYGLAPVGILNMILPRELELTSEQTELLCNTAEDMAIGISAARQRQEQQLIEVTNAANNERLEIARDLHDTLGQNLGFLHLKLDQFLTMERRLFSKKIINELVQLRDLSNESYELVRSTLVILHHSSDHRISELFHAHTSSITKRAHITFEMEEKGVPRSIPPNYVRQLLFAYKEILYNIEQHARASHINVCLTWADDMLDVSIMDNGCGFDNNDVIEIGHYGLNILKERIHSLGGQANIISSPGHGTEVKFWLPLEEIDNEQTNIYRG